MVDVMPPASNVPSPLTVEGLTHQAQRLRASADALDALAATLATVTQTPAPMPSVVAPSGVGSAPEHGGAHVPLAPLISVR